MHFDSMGLDVGYGRTKIAVRLPSEQGIFTDSFPSLVPQHVSENLSSHVPSAEVARTYIVKIDGVEFAVGPDVRFSIGGQTGSGRTLTDDFPMSVNYKALFLGALAHVGATEIDVLVLGLPVHTMEKYKAHLATTFKGTFKAGEKEVVVHDVRVLPQPSGAMIHYGTTLSESLNDGENRLIIDCGYVTTDWVLANGYRMIESRSSGTPVGASTILMSIANRISKFENKQFDHIERIDESLITNKPMRLFKKMIAPEIVRDYLTSSSFIMEDTAKKIRANVGDGSDLCSILMVGGGARYFGPSIQKSFPDVEIIYLDESPYCNVRGFLLMGEAQAKRNKTLA